MRGFPAYAIGAPDGHWLLTLYIKPHEAFVHALDLQHAVAYCLDLPGHGGAELQNWALVLGLDGRTLYAANGALGLATRIDLGTLESARPLRFVAPLGADQYVNSALSPRGDLVYFGGLHGLWAWRPAREPGARAVPARPHRRDRVHAGRAPPDGDHARRARALARRRDGEEDSAGPGEVTAVSPRHAGRPHAASSVAPVWQAYERALRPCLGTSSAPLRRG